jgi:uncharacterized protein (DUF362 family)/NAD-dependent dihydropyrimidine dehydrogenase PreA subunit
MTGVAESAGIPLNFDTSFDIVSFPEGERFRRFEIIRPVSRADALINVCKLKTHSFMHMTGAVKNLFGVIAGLTKPGYHAKLREKDLFAGMLLDLMACVSPRLSIMDAVEGMEGNGPHGGEPRAVGWLMGSTSALALDVAASAVVGLPKEMNPLLVEAQRRGLDPVDLDRIELIGGEARALPVPGFRLPSTAVQVHDRLLNLLSPVVKSAFSVRPRVIEEKCVSCGACREACPMHVISLAPGRPARIQDKDCIRCYCCHEMCPHGAIDLRSGWLYRLLNRRIWAQSVR